MSEVKFSRGMQVNYDALQVKDADTIYICTDTGNSYLGGLPLSSENDMYWEEM